LVQQLGAPSHGDHPRGLDGNGAGRRHREKRAQAIRFLRQFRVEHPTEDDNRWAMRQTARFHLSHGIQLQDAMIASVAARLAVPLYTTNLKHFQALPSVDAQKPY
jgi:predicted nucleic acid-binding protein